MKGRLVKVASIRDEEVTEGVLVDDVATFVVKLSKSSPQPDVLTFSDRACDASLRPGLKVHWENLAVVPITTLDAWYGRLCKGTRRNIARAQRLGVEARRVMFDDELARGIHRICNETPIRQGRLFWHFGKDFEQVKAIHATYLGRSDFFGAYFNGELIAFVKVVYVDRVASIMHILGMNSHRNKQPMSLLLAKVMETCVQRGVTSLRYGSYVYGNKTHSTLTEFKRRHGFERVDYPRYYVPISPVGRIYVTLQLYRGVVELLPEGLVSSLARLRAYLDRARLNLQGHGLQN